MKKIFITGLVFCTLLLPSISLIHAQEEYYDDTGGDSYTSTPTAPAATPPATTQTTNPPAATTQTTNPPATTQSTNPPAATQTTNPPAATQTTNPPAATQTTNQPAATQNTPTPATTPGLLVNPLNKNYSSIPGILGALLSAVEYIGAIACALWIIWGGFLFVKAQGNSEALSDAKKTLLHAIIGTLIILGAGAILSVITSTINTIKS